MGRTSPNAKRLTSAAKLTPIVICLIFAAVIGVEVYEGLRELIAYRQTTGRITQYDAPDPFATDPERPDARLEYEYKVNDRIVEGKFPPKRWIDSPQPPFRLLKEVHSPNDSIDVFYDPSAPDRSTLEPRINPSIALFVTFLAPVAVLAVAGLRRNRTVNGALFAQFEIQVAYLLGSFIVAVPLYLLMRVAPWQLICFLGVLLPTIVIPAGLRRIHRYLNAGNPADFERRRDILLTAIGATFCWCCLSPFLLHCCVFWADVIQHELTWNATEGTIARVERRPDDTPTQPRIVCRYETQEGAVDNARLRIARFDLLNPRERANLMEEYDGPGKRVRILVAPTVPTNAIADSPIPTGVCVESFVTTIGAIVGALLLVSFSRAIRRRVGPAGNS